MSRILVIGSGVAGVAAAWEARRLGAEVTLASRGPGASGQSSGAFDCGSAPAVQPPEDVGPNWGAWEGFLHELWQVGYEAEPVPLPAAPAQIATSAGLLRRATMADPFLLDFGLLPKGSRIIVADLSRSDFPAKLLARGLASSAKGDFEFIAMELELGFSTSSRTLPGAAWAARLQGDARRVFLDSARETARRQGAKAVLFGPWLAQGGDPAQLRQGEILLGETTSPPDGAAGRRLSRALARMITGCGVDCQETWIEELRVSEQGLSAPPLVGSFAQVVLATGGLVGGGIVLDPTPGRSFGSPLISGSSETVGSLRGFDAAADRGRFLSAPSAAGLRSEGQDERLHLAGDVRAGARLTLLSAIADGLRAGHQAALAATLCAN